MITPLYAVSSWNHRPCPTASYGLQNYPYIWWDKMAPNQRRHTTGAVKRYPAMNNTIALEQLPHCAKHDRREHRKAFCLAAAFVATGPSLECCFSRNSDRC